MLPSQSWSGVRGQTRPHGALPPSLLVCEAALMKGFLWTHADGETTPAASTC